MRAVLPFVVTFALAAVAGADADVGADAPCAGKKEPLKAAVPALGKGPFARLFTGLDAVGAQSSLVVDEHHVTFALAGDRALPTLRVSLALPAPWRGVVDLVPRKVEGAWCSRATAVLFDKDLREATFSGLPVDVSVTIGKRGQAARTFTVKPDAVSLSSDVLSVTLGDAGEMRLYVGDGPPDEEVLEQDGADLYLKSLAALDPGLVDEMRAHPSAQAQRVLFAEVAASLRSELRTWTPERRLKEIQRFDERAMPAELRPLVHFWRTELQPSAQKRDASAHLIVDDAVQSLWVDAVEVFNRKKGTPTGFDLKVPREAVRFWIVTSEQGTPVVHDTRAVLRGGEIYSVTSTFVQHMRGGARRECVRVGGKLPFHKDIRWREISGTHTPMLGDHETYRPSVASAERALSVVPGGDSRPFPPVPLVYSYTHPGLYKWTLAADGGVKLELVDDPKLCPR